MKVADEPVWIAAFDLEFLARAVVVELGVPVRLPSRLRVLTYRVIERRDDRRPRRGGYPGTRVVRVPSRSEDAVAAAVRAAREAWLAGQRDPALLAHALHDAVASNLGIRGDRGFLAAIAALWFLELNGWLAPSTVRDLVLRVRRLAGSTGAAAATVLRELAVQRVAPGSS